MHFIRVPLWLHRGAIVEFRQTSEKKVYFREACMISTPIPHPGHFPGGRWLLCEPTFFNVTYEINPWMSVKRGPVLARAHAQWQTLHHLLIRLGAWVEYVEPTPAQPDMAFTANAGLVRGNTCVLSRFFHRERSGESVGYRAWFEQNGYRVVEVANGAFEGEGDALFAGETLFAGYGFRTDPSALETAASELNVSDLVACRLVDPRYYHLDTCFCPVRADLALIVRRAFDAETLVEMERRLELLSVDDDEGERFACNSVVLGNTIIIPSGCPKTVAMLLARGFECFDVEMDEFLKAGGAAKCLSLRLSH